jgi:hypothetical protein
MNNQNPANYKPKNFYKTTKTLQPTQQLQSFYAHALDPREGPENATGLFESVRLGDIASSRLKHPFPGPAGRLRIMKVIHRLWVGVYILRASQGIDYP